MALKILPLKQKVIRHIETHQNTKQRLESSLDSIYSKKEDEKVKQFEKWYEHFYKDTSYKNWNPAIKPAKLNAMFETFKFCLEKPMHIICGAGPGCFLQNWRLKLPEFKLPDLTQNALFI